MEAATAAHPMDLPVQAEVVRLARSGRFRRATALLKELRASFPTVSEADLRASASRAADAFLSGAGETARAPRRRRG